MPNPAAELKLIREALGLSQRAFATRLGLSASHVAHLEKETTMRGGTMILDGRRIRFTSGTAERVRKIWAMADEGGTVQAGDMVRLFPGEPTRHTATSLLSLLGEIGAEIMD